MIFKNPPKGPPKHSPQDPPKDPIEPSDEELLQLIKEVHGGDAWESQEENITQALGHLEKTALPAYQDLQQVIQKGQARFKPCASQVPSQTLSEPAQPPAEAAIEPVEPVEPVEVISGRGADFFNPIPTRTHIIKRSAKKKSKKPSKL